MLAWRMMTTSYAGFAMFRIFVSIYLILFWGFLLEIVWLIMEYAWLNAEKFTLADPT